MALVRAADFLPGMVLDADVVAEDGRLLAATGTVLTDRHVQILRKWGIEAAVIRGGPTEDPAVAVDPAALALVEAQVEALFERANGDHPAMRELMDLVRARLLRASCPETPDAS